MINRIEYDEEVDAAYIYLEYPIRKGQVKETVELNEDIALDLDEEGRLLGVEVLEASHNLKDKKLAAAQAA